MTKFSIRKIDEMREVLMDSTASAPEQLYFVIHQPGKNVTILPHYRLGREYPKTYGHFHKPEAEERYRILMGEVGILIQKGVDHVEEIRLIKLKKGGQFTVPKGYAHSLINLGRGPVVTLDDHDPEKFENDYHLIKGKHGFAYYLTEEKGKLKTIPNPNYVRVPSLIKEEV